SSPHGRSESKSDSTFCWSEREAVEETNREKSLEARVTQPLRVGEEASRGACESDPHAAIDAIDASAPGCPSADDDSCCLHRLAHRRRLSSAETLADLTSGAPPHSTMSSSLWSRSPRALAVAIKGSLAVRTIVRGVD